MASVSVCKCGVEISKIGETQALEHARHYAKKKLEEMEMNSEPKASWQYGVAFNKIQSFFQRKATCPLTDCKQYVEAHSMIECVQHVKSYLNSIELGVGEKNEKN